MWKQKQNKLNKKLGFLHSGLRVQEQAYVRRQEYAYSGPCPKNPKNTTKPKTLNVTP